MSGRVLIADLRARARKHRQNPTRSEFLLWRRVRKRRLGVKFRRQHVLYPYIVDFYCGAAKLCVEIDGPYHVREHDQRRDRALSRSHGVRVLRVSAHDVEYEMGLVLAAIEVELADG